MLPLLVVAACHRESGEVRVVMVSIDGLMPETYLEPDRLGLAVPTLRALVARGAYARVESVFPTVTYPAHTTLVTGAPPAVHRITTNKAPDPSGRNQEGWRWYSEDIAVPTLWQQVAAAGRPVGIVQWPVTVGADVAFRVPEYWRAGTLDDQKLLRSLSTPGVLEQAARAEPRLWQWLVPPDVLDAAPFAIAKDLYTREKPDLMLVHGFELDDAQHGHAPRSAEAVRAIENADRLLGELVAALDDRTILVVVSDHGFAPIDHEIRPYAWLVERGLVTATAAAIAISANGGTAYVYLRDPAARGVLAELAKLPGIAGVVDRAQLAAAGGDPDAELALVAAPGYGFSENHQGPLVVDTPGKGTHGWPPTDPAMRASFIAVGPGIAHRDLGTIQMTQIAPTLARWLGVNLSGATGRALDL
jgi:predicted AlkP superfamily pyrophosphatase or phosphodiesterase